MINLTTSEIDEALSKVDKGVGQYLWIQSRIGEATEIEDDQEFRRRYNHFYRVRRSVAWQDAFYNLMKRARSERLEFPAVLNLLHQATGRYEASFTSKLLATLNPSLPVIDSVVLKNVGLRIPSSKSSDRAAGICRVHNQLSILFDGFLRTREGIYLVSEFDKKYPDVVVTDVKKLDLVLWQSRAFERSQDIESSRDS